MSVYQDYKDKISYSAWSKAISGDTWKNVDTSMIQGTSVVERAGKNKNKLTKEDVLFIREQYENNIMTKSELFKKYFYVTPRTINRIINYETWKDIKPVSTIPYHNEGK